MAAARDSKSRPARGVGSSPTSGTSIELNGSGRIDKQRLILRKMSGGGKI